LLLLLTTLTSGYFLYDFFVWKSTKVQMAPELDIASDTLLEFDDKFRIFQPIANSNFDLSFEIFGSLDSSGNSGFQGFSSNYAEDVNSIFCFRGNQQRNQPSRGHVLKNPNAIEVLWDFKTIYDGTTTAYGTWGGGAGWTGQAMVIQWTREQKLRLGIVDSSFLDNDEALEIIIGSLCGNIYFLNAETGLPTRKHLSIGNPIKGSVSIDPRKNGLLYVGQGVQHNARFGAYIFDMFNGNELLYISGKDKDAKRKWGAFDSNALIDSKSGQIFWPAENGLIYSFQISEDRAISPMAKMRYEHSKLFRAGIESSMAAIDSFGFFSDNSGSVICINLKTLEPIWNVSNDDDSDATIAIDKEDDGSYFLYTGNEVDRLAPVNTAYFRKLDAQTGAELWKVGRSCRGTALNGKTNSGGILSSPVIGKKQGKDLVYCVFSRVDKNNHGEFIAINKHTGEEAFTILMDHYSWSSPVDLYDEDGRIYIFFTDVAGTIYLIDGLSGDLIIKEKTAYTFESSPVAVNDQIFIASRGQSILSFKLKNLVN
jgi:outer membrane protein assembly factor BamB